MTKRILIAGAILLCVYSGADAATRYISKTGNDSRSGDSWDQAWLTLTHVNDPSRFSHGDTAVFGSGIWRETLYTISGTGADKTCYIDSTFLAGNHDRRVAWIYGSDALSGWTPIGATNVYICTYSPSNLNNYVSVWQGDSILFRQADSTAVNMAGESWYGNGHVIAYIYNDGNGYDPDSYTMEFTQQECVFMCVEGGTGGEDNVSFVGLGFKYSSTKQVNSCDTGVPELGWDSCLFSHCSFSCNSGSGSNNAGLIYNNAPTSVDPMGSGISDGYDYNRFVACSLGQNFPFQSSLPQARNSYNGGGIDLYGLRYSKIDSCVFWGELRTDGAIKFKCVYNDDGPDAYYDTICFNTFQSDNTSAIQFYGGVAHCLVYGNIFDGDYSNAVWMNYSDNGDGTEGYNQFFNNTIYNCRFVKWDDDYSYSYPSHDNEFKYNILYRTSSGQIMTLDSLDTWTLTDIDSNMYYISSGTLDWRAPVQHANSYSYTSNTFSQWQALGVDAHSTANVDPGFANIGIGDFSRPSASGEMSRTYGGQAWTVYGAVQEAVTGPRIGASPTSFSFAALEGGASPSAKSLSVFNAGTETLNWSVSDGAAWLHLSPTSGTNTGTVSVSVDPIAAGTYSTNITISASGADNSPRTIPVYYTVTVPDYDPPVISFGADSSLATSSTNNIVWQTDEPATSQVEYGFNAAYGHLTTLDPELVTAHSVPLTGLTADTVYHFRVISRDGSDNEAVSQDSVFRTPVQPPNLALGRPATVSGTYSGYSTGVICDGVIDPFGGTSTTWASDESSAAHWVEIDLQQSAPVSSVRIYWANNTYSSNWMRSQLITIQGWTGSTWNDLVTVDNVVGEIVTYPDTVITYDEFGTPTGFSVTVSPPGDDITTTDAGFNTVITSRIRVFQPGSQGPATYPSIMWLTEVEVYTDDITPPTSKL
jgi:hypothetical protein